MPAEPTEIFETSGLLQHLEGRMKDRKEAFGLDRIEHDADVIVTGDPLHLEQGVAVGPPTPGALLQSALVGQERRALHEKDGKRRHANINHGVAHIFALAPVKKTGAGLAQCPNQALQDLHRQLESRPLAGEHSQAPSHVVAPRPAGSAPK